MFETKQMYITGIGMEQGKEESETPPASWYMVTYNYGLLAASCGKGKGAKPNEATKKMKTSK
jgi:hypothetical protein